MFALPHVARFTLLAEAVACKEFKSIAVVSRNKDTRFALEGQSQCMQQQSFSIFCSSNNPRAQRTVLCDEIAGDLSIGVAYDQGTLGVVCQVRGKNCAPIGSKARSVERNQRW